MRTILFVLVPGVAVASPLLYTHQGRLLDSSGNGLNGNHTLTVTLDDAGGSPVWEDAITTAFANGYFTVTLGTDDTGRTLEQAFYGSNPAVSIAVAADGIALGSPSPLDAVPRAARAGAVDVGASLVGTSCPGAGALAYDTATADLVACNGATWQLAHPPVALMARKTSAQAMGPGAIVTFPSEEFDTHDAWDGSAYTCPLTGIYRVSWQLYSVAWSDPDWDVALVRDGLVWVRDDMGARNPTLPRIVNRTSVLVPCDAGHILQIKNISDQGSQANYTSAVDNWISIERI